MKTIKDYINKQEQLSDYFNEQLNSEDGILLEDVNKIADFYNKIDSILESINIHIIDESYIEEKANEKYSYSKLFSDVKNIVNTFSKTDLSHICSGTFKDSPYVKYREVLLVNKDPAAFIDVYSIPEEMEKMKVL